MKPLLARVLLATAALAAGVLFVTCGLDEDYYLPPIAWNNVRWESSNTIASIQLPDYPGDGYYYFTGFKLYYRIYISGENRTEQIRPTDISKGTEDNLTAINSSLWSDFRSLYPYTDTTGTGVNIGNTANLLAGRGFYELELEGANIDNIFSDATLTSPTFTNGYTIPIYIDFTDQVGGVRKNPTLEFGSPATNRYNLYRSTGEGRFRPRPGPEDPSYYRYFINTAELYDSANATAEINADVANSATTNIRQTYAAFYIVVIGLNDTNFTPIYSAPTFIGVFRLP